MGVTPNSCRISEIFYSIQGESTLVGWPTVFVRLTGCPLRCQYCDTDYAFHGGETHSYDVILQQVQAHGCQHVCVTGGEPLAQRNCLALLTRLCDAGHTVSLETSGAIDIAPVDERVHIIMDLKTPGSKQQSFNRYENVPLLRQDKDNLKFVICDYEDYCWAKRYCEDNALLSRLPVLFSASHEQLAAEQLAEWILSDKLLVRLQCQLHKFIWEDSVGR